MELFKMLILGFRESQHGKHKGKYFASKRLKRGKSPVSKIPKSTEARSNPNTTVVLQKVLRGKQGRQEAKCSVFFP